MPCIQLIMLGQLASVSKWKIRVKSIFTSLHQNMFHNKAKRNVKKETTEILE